MENFGNWFVSHHIDLYTERLIDSIATSTNLNDAMTIICSYKSVHMCIVDKLFDAFIRININIFSKEFDNILQRFRNVIPKVDHFPSYMTVNDEYTIIEWIAVNKNVDEYYVDVTFDMWKKRFRYRLHKIQRKRIRMKKIDSVIDQFIPKDIRQNIILLYL